MFLASLAPRPPLIIDDCQEAMDLFQDMNQSKNSCNLDIRESDVVAKASRAMSEGSLVVVQIHNPGSSREVAVISAITFACRQSLEAGLMSLPSSPRSIQPDEDHSKADSHQRTTGHRLYFRALSLGVSDEGELSPTRLSPDLLRVVSPVMFSYERKEMDCAPLTRSPLLCFKDLLGPSSLSSQLSRKLTEVLIQALLGIDAAAEIREAKTNAWETMRIAEGIR